MLAAAPRSAAPSRRCCNLGCGGCASLRLSVISSAHYHNRGAVAGFGLIDRPNGCMSLPTNPRAEPSAQLVGGIRPEGERDVEREREREVERGRERWSSIIKKSATKTPRRQEQRSRATRRRPNAELLDLCGLSSADLLKRLPSPQPQPHSVHPVNSCRPSENSIWRSILELQLSAVCHSLSCSEYPKSMALRPVSGHTLSP